MALTLGHPASPMPTCDIRPTMKMADQSARGFNLQKPPIFPTGESRESRQRAGDSFYLALFTGQRQTDRLIMRDESDVAGRHAFRHHRALVPERPDYREALPCS
jgi:hypothetical protein